MQMIFHLPPFTSYNDPTPNSTSYHPLPNPNQTPGQSKLVVSPLPSDFWMVITDSLFSSFQTHQRRSPQLCLLLL